MTRFTIILGSLCCIIAYSSSWGATSAIESLSDIIFPDSIQYRKASDIPMVRPENLTKTLKERIASASSHCVSEYIKRGQWAPKSELRYGSIVGLDSDDIMLVGETPCAEGDQTIVWRHVSDPSAITMVAQPGRIVRIERGKQARFTIMVAGCCETKTNIFATGSNFPVIDKYVTAPKSSADGVGGLEIPAQTMVTSQRIVLPRPTKLEPAPLSLPIGVGQNPTEYILPAGTIVKCLLVFKDSNRQTWKLIKYEQKYDITPPDDKVTIGWSRITDG